MTLPSELCSERIQWYVTNQGNDNNTKDFLSVGDTIITSVIQRVQGSRQ
jgi:hypothetical protein